MITANEASKSASKAPTEKDVLLNDIYKKIKRISTATTPDISLSYLIPRGKLSVIGNQIKPALEANGYTVVVQKYKKVAPIMESVGVLLIGW